jgi:hypothetical protein
MRHPPVRDDVRLWESQFFHMPNFADSTIAAAFAPENFLGCEEGGFAGGCASMDYPTTIPDNTETPADESRVPHADTTGPADPGWLGKWLGDPVFSYSGPFTLALTAASDGSATSGVVTVKNVGAGIAPFRIRTTHPWIVVRHDSDPFPRTLDGSVAVGSEIDVVLQKETDSQPRITQPGYESVLRITLNTAAMPPGLTVGAVHLEPLLGSGGAFTVEIIAANGASGLPHQAIIPKVAQD